ncbi:protein of unknown function [Burkholderia multivorans]
MAQGRHEDRRRQLTGVTRPRMPPPPETRAGAAAPGRARGRGGSRHTVRCARPRRDPAAARGAAQPGASRT